MRKENRTQKKPYLPMRNILWRVIWIVIIVLVALLFFAHFLFGWSVCYWKNIYPTLVDISHLFLKGDCDYAAATKLITAIGLSGFAISSFNTYRIKRSHGIIHYYLLKFYFPTYLLIYVLHILFVLIGLYSCEMGIDHLIACSLIGLGVSFSHSILMILATEHDWFFSRWLIERFAKCAKKQGCAGLLANDVAIHISSSFQNTSSSKGMKIHAGDPYDLELLILLLSLDEKNHDAEQWQKKDRDETNSDTKQRRGQTQNHAKGYTNASALWMMNILYTVPFTTRKDDSADEMLYYGKTLSHQIRQCCAMWEACECGTDNKDKNKTAKIAAMILSYALTENEQTAFALMCGLLLYLRLPQITGQSDARNDDWQACCNYLNLLLSSAQGSQNDTDQSLRRHMVLLSLSLLYWEQYVLMPELRCETDTKSILKKLSSLSGKQIDAFSLHTATALNVYAACAFLICKAYDARSCYPFTRNNISFWHRHLMPQLEKKSRHCLS